MASARSSRKDLSAWISPGSPQDHLIRTCTRSCKDLWQDCSRAFATSSHKDLNKTLVNIFHIIITDLQDCTMRLLQDRHSRTFQRIHIFIRSDLFTRISGNQLKSAPRQTKSDSTRAKCREGCATYVKIRTAPQRERSDKHKVTRGLREHFHKTVRAPRNMNMNIENVKNDVFPCFTCSNYIHLYIYI